MNRQADREGDLLKSVRRPDAVTKYKAVEIEMSGRRETLVAAARRLKESGKPQKVLIVPSKSLKAAKDAMWEVGVSGTVRNLNDTRRSYVAHDTKPAEVPIKK